MYPTSFPCVFVFCVNAIDLPGISQTKQLSVSFATRRSNMAVSRWPHLWDIVSMLRVFSSRNIFPVNIPLPLRQSCGIKFQRMVNYRLYFSLAFWSTGASWANVWAFQRITCEAANQVHLTASRTIKRICSFRTQFLSICTIHLDSTRKRLKLVQNDRNFPII